MQYLFKVALVIAAMYITYKLFMSREKYYAVNRATILSSVAASFVIPLVKLPYLNKEVVVDASAQTSTEVMDIAPAAMAAETEASISTSEIIPYIMAAGVVLFFLKFQRFTRLIPREIPPKVPPNESRYNSDTFTDE